MATIPTLLDLNQDNFENRLCSFTLCFIKIFAHKLCSYNREAVSKGGKMGKVSKALNWTLEDFIGPAIGVSLWYITIGLPGVVGGVKTGNVLWWPFTKLVSWLTLKRHREKAINVSKVIGNFVYLGDVRKQSSLLKLLSAVSVDIFTAFEYQLMRVTCEEGWAVAMYYVAYDAVSRIINYIHKQGEKFPNDPLETVLLKGVRDGRSKTHLTFTVCLRYQDNKKTLHDNSDKWPLWELWTQPGIIHDKMCRVADGCNTFKHGYRKPFNFETSFPEAPLREVRNTASVNYILRNVTDTDPHQSMIHNQCLPQDLKTEIQLGEIKAELKSIKQKLEIIEDKSVKDETNFENAEPKLDIIATELENGEIKLDNCVPELYITTTKLENGEIKLGNYLLQFYIIATKLENAEIKLTNSEPKMSKMQTKLDISNEEVAKDELKLEYSKQKLDNFETRSEKVEMEVTEPKLDKIAAKLVNGKQELEEEPLDEDLLEILNL